MRNNELLKRIARCSAIVALLTQTLTGCIKPNSESNRPLDKQKTEFVQPQNFSIFIQNGDGVHSIVEKAVIELQEREIWDNAQWVNISFPLIDSSELFHVPLEPQNLKNKEWHWSTVVENILATQTDVITPNAGKQANVFVR